MYLKRLNVRLLGLTAGSALFLAASSATYAGSAASNLDVSATVTANCTISTTPITFGNYDPIVANATTPLEAQGAITVTCTSGDATTITLDQGSDPAAGSNDTLPLRQMKDSGTDVLAYALYQDSGYTTVWGNTVGTGVDETGTGVAQNVTVYGAVTAGQNVPAGTYSDVVIATVTF